MRIDRSAIEQWGIALGGEKYLAQLIGRNPSRIYQIKKAGEAPIDLLEEIGYAIARWIRGERTDPRLRRPDPPRVEGQPSPDQILASLIGKVATSELLRPEWPFVGRRRERERCAELLADAARGAGRSMLIVGGPGMGKSSLLQRCAQLAEQSGARVWIGRCAATPLASAWAPWIQILDQCLRDIQPDGSRDPRPRTLAGLLRALHRRLPGSARHAQVHEGDATELFFQSIWGLLQALAERSPVLLALDNLDVADEASRALWSFAADQLTFLESRVLLLATARKTPGVAEALEVWELEGLSQREVSEVVLERFPEASPAEAASVFRLARGHPLLTRELLDAHGPSDTAQFLAREAATQELPGRARPLLEGLLADLPADTLRTLEAGAVLGSCFRPDLLGSLCEGRVELPAALQRGLIQPVDGVAGLYELTPHLLRQHLYQQIEPRRLAALHKLAAEALRARSPAAPDELAHHLLRAGGDSCAQGVAWAVRAAEGATALMDYGEAALQYREALMVVPVDDALACTLRLALARSQNRAGQIGAADATLHATVLRARSLAAHQVVCEAALELGAQAPYILPRTSEHATLLEEAMANAQHDPALRAKLGARLAAMLCVADPERSRVLAQESLELVRELRDREPSTWVYVHEATYIALLRPNCAASVENAQEICALAEQAQDLDLMLRTRRAVVDATMRTAQTGDEIRRALLRYAGLSERSKQPESRAWAQIFDSSLSLMVGRMADAERLSAETCEASIRAGDANAYPIRAGQELAFWLCVRDWKGLEQQVKAPQPRLWDLPDTGGRAFLAAKLGRWEEARHAVDQLAANGFRDLHEPLLWPLGVWLISETLRDLDLPQHAAAIARILVPRRDENLVLGLGVAHLGPASRCLGLLAEAQGDRMQAAQLFEHALLRTQRLGAEPWIAATEADLARVLLARRARGDTDRAERLLGSALQRAERLELSGLAAECSALGARVRRAAGPRSTSP